MEINKESTNKKRLGRGLGSLLGANDVQGLADYSSETTVQPKAAAQKPTIQTQAAPPVTTQAQIDPEQRIWNIAIDKLVPGIYQPRKNFEKAALQELADSIKENGILQPIAVRKRTAGGYEIIAGERRWRAAQIAGLHEVPAIIKNISDRDALQLAIIENVQREDLDAIEEAESYQRLIEEFSLSQQDVAEKVGKERSTVANALRLLLLPNELKDFLMQKAISPGHAKVLLSVSDKTKQIQLAKQVIEKNMSVRALESEIKNLSKNTKTGAESALEVAGGNMNMAEKLAQELSNQL
jgi:ParB family transcriptional regulator, chromosome partitioning protein